MAYPTFYEAYLATQNEPRLKEKRLTTPYGVIEFYKDRGPGFDILGVEAPKMSQTDQALVYYIQVYRPETSDRSTSFWTNPTLL